MKNISLKNSVYFLFSFFLFMVVLNLFNRSSVYSSEREKIEEKVKKIQLSGNYSENHI